MRISKRPGNRAQKRLLVASLLFAPLLMAFVAVGVQSQNAVSVSIPVERIEHVAFSPDGRHLAVLTSNNPFSGNCDTGEIFNAQTGVREARLQVPKTDIALSSPVWSPDSSRLATGYTKIKSDPLNYKPGGIFQVQVAIWNAVTGARINLFSPAPAQKYEMREFARAYLHWTHKDQLWSTGTPPSLFDVPKGQVVRRLPLPFNPPLVRGGQFNASQSLIAIYQVGKGIFIYDVQSGRLVREFLDKRFGRVFWSHEDDVLAILWEDELEKGLYLRRSLQLLNARTGQIFSTPPVTHFEDVVFSRSGQVILVDTVWQRAGKNEQRQWKSSRLLNWDYQAAKMSWEKAYSGPKLEYSLNHKGSPDGRLFSFLEDTAPLRTWVVWDAATGKEIWRRKVNPREHQWCGRPTVSIW